MYHVLNVFQSDSDSRFIVPGNNFLVYHADAGGKAYQYEFDLGSIARRIPIIPWPEWMGLYFSSFVFPSTTYFRYNS